MVTPGVVELSLPDPGAGAHPDAPLLVVATGVAALVVVLGLVWWGRLLDRAGAAGPPVPPGAAAGLGAVRGLVVGLLVAGVAELATFTTLRLFPTDVRVSGFTLLFGTPAAVVVAALCWWRDRPPSAVTRLVLAALPVALVGAVGVGIQWASQ